MKTTALHKFMRSVASGIVLAATFLMPHAAHAGVVKLATKPLANSATTEVRPNLMFILDNSGSMNWDYMPDLVVDANYCKGSGTRTSLRCCRNPTGYDLSSTGVTSTCLPSSSEPNLRGMPPFYSADFNKIYYDPAVTYSPPFDHNGDERTSYSGTSSIKLDGYEVQTTDELNLLSDYPDVEWCTDSTHADCLRNGDYLLPGVVGGKLYSTMRATTATGTHTFAVGQVNTPSTEVRAAGPFYYVMVPGEYCTDNNLTTCVVATAPSATHSVPAKLRWCRNADRTDCRATQSNTYNFPRYPTLVTGSASTAAFNVSRAERSNGNGIDSACNGRSNVITVSSVKAGSYELLPAAFRYCNSDSSETKRNLGLAEAIATRIGRGFSGDRSGVTVVVTAPSAAYNGQRLESTISNASLTRPTFSGTAGSRTFVPGAFTRIDIVPGATYGNIVVEGTTVVDRSRRADCADAPNCTYAEELRNFANWFVWYRTRMQAMKTSVSRAFVTIDSTYRVGFSAINDPQTIGRTTINNYLRIDDFAEGGDGHKSRWYARLFNAVPNGGTPLRSALANVGRLYASSGDDNPVQYSCQQNFSLLTTDGYWNGDTRSDAIRNVQGSAVGNQDGRPTERPYYEGPTESENSLADVAKYYYETDLRTEALGNCASSIAGEELCKNNVFTSGDDNNAKQHMTTFTLGLGVDGELRYRSDYKTARSGDYWNILNGLGSPQANWPVPTADSPRAVDDLWHAAVNGRGTYFSAGNPKELSSGLRSALTEMQVRVGAGAAAATSTLSPVAGDNFAYVASYTTLKWTGNLEAREIDLDTGEVGSAPLHCVENVPASEGIAPCTGTMVAMVGANEDTRLIYTSGSSGLVSFTYENLTETQQAYFKASTLSQWGGLTEAQQEQATGANLVNYLRGQYGFEMRTDNAVSNQVFRRRDAVLGDLVESTPNYVGRPKFSYTDPGYEAFKTANALRGATIYVGSNDGMLHAFNATDLTERWAFVPSMVIPHMALLADQNYGTLHRYYVNGAPVVSDICTANCTNAATAVWKTVLIGGLNGGGRGYYALDVTDPTSPALLWEFTVDDEEDGGGDLGYSFGNPVVTKLEDGQWVVALTSGYNNVEGPNAGEGFLYVLDAWTGGLVRKIGTGVGSSTNPSGLSRIAVWVDDLSRNNTAGYAYGGDLLGNVWRFDLNSSEETGVNPLKFATLFSDAGATEPQPITTRPELGRLNGKRIVFVGTGKYLEVGDLSDDQVQSLYAIKDDDVTTTLVNPRTSLVQQSFTETVEATRVGTSNPVPSSARGWYVDLPDRGERQNVASELVSGVLIVPTTVPSATACEPGGYSWLNFLDYKTGGPVPTWSRVSTRFSAPIVGINIVYIDGKPRVSVVKADNPTPEIVDTEEFPGGGAAFQSKRAVWREVIQ